MIVWTVNFQIVRPLLAFARPVRVEMEIQSDSSYHVEGCWRLNDRHCIFVYSLAGNGVFRDKDVEHYLPPGTGFLCEVGNPDIAYYYPPSGSEPWQFVWFGFVGESATAKVRDLIARHGPIYALPQGKGLIKRLMAYANYNGLIYELTPFDGASLVLDVLATLGNCAYAQNTDSPQSTSVRHAQDIIRENLQTKINATDVAKRVRISREHLSRVFKKYTGVTLHDYILQQKMLLACRLLKETQLTNKEISYRVGFDRPTNFSRTFSRVVHMTPNRYKVEGTKPFL